MANTYTNNIALAKPSNNDTAWGTTLNSNATILDGLTPIGALAAQTVEHPSTSLNIKVSAGSFRKSDGSIVAYAGTASQAMTASQTNYLYLTDSGSLVVNTTGFPAATYHVRLATVVAGATTITGIADARIPFVVAGHTALSAGSAGVSIAGSASGTTTLVAVAAASGTLTLPAATDTLVGRATADTLTNKTLTAPVFSTIVNTGTLTLPTSTDTLVGRATTDTLTNKTLTSPTLGGTVAVSDAANVTFGTTTGTRHGTATTQKQSFWNATPIVQPAGANQGALTDSTTGTAGFTIGDVGAAFNQATLNNNLASIVRLLNQLRSDLVAAGLIKGSA